MTLWPLILLFIVGAMGFSIMQSARINTAWEEASKQMNMTLSKSWFGTREMRGERRGVAVVAEEHRESTGSGKHRTTVYYLDISVGLSAPWMCGIQITKRGFGDKIAEFFGGEDVSVGSAGFDKDFRVRGVVTDEIKEAIRDRNTQLCFQRLKNGYQKFWLQDGSIKVRRRGRPKSASELVRQVNTAVELANELNQATSQPRQDSIADARNQAPAEALFPDPSPPKESVGHEDGGDSEDGYGNVSW